MLSLCANRCAPAGLWSPLRFLQSALVGDGPLTTKLNALARHPNLVTTGLAGSSGQAQLVLLDAPVARPLLAHRERFRAPVPAEDIAPVYAVGEFHLGEPGLDLRAFQRMECLSRGGCGREPKAYACKEQRHATPGHPFTPSRPVTCLVAEHSWDRVRWAIEEF